MVYKTQDAKLKTALFFVVPFFIVLNAGDLVVA